ncbi:helix-turn-helix domain-containing protein [Chitinophaga oryzae]|uniref:Helix-turn-helix domain-containing protein n=1 Tax=Chitinophaga oryzae TaxID=2725414 RepID=A0AAE6ZH63_9BACT|nr:helix-turn-helix domain-containing protein [Chitinophaga oryzae]QJB32616.1 helix-turn-helix domain-containing protein [Chitinophaga oryzae]QJB39068.1 helix-turn-helix domain-containing protein [Chitinophaga oryzae]
MKHVSILVLNDAVMASIVDPHMMLSGVNGFLEDAGKLPAFKLQLLGLTPMVKQYNGLFSVHTDKMLKEVKRTDLVIIPAIAGDFEATLYKNREFIPWIIRQYKENGADVASLCSGAFVLAATGLLDGLECSSHWASANLFRQLFPDVVLVNGRIVTEQQGLYSSGGANSYWNLLLHLVEKYTDRETAIMASKVYALDIDRTSQSPFAMFSGQKKHEDAPIRLAQEYIEANIHQRISVEELSDRFAIGRRHFVRRFKKATDNTPLEYIQRVRMEAAKKKLESSRMNVNEVMYEVGYSDSKAFRAIFKKLTGMLPADYRLKYNKEAAVETSRR